MKYFFVMTLFFLSLSRSPTLDVSMWKTLSLTHGSKPGLYKPTKYEPYNFSIFIPLTSLMGFVSFPR